MAIETLISIVINNYNYGSFLRRAIESALAQTHRAIEIVIVDDGSTDGSTRIIADYAGRCRAVLGENRGQGAAYNAGFAASRGDIVLFLDADDFLYPDAAAAIAAAWAPDVAKVQFPLDVVDAAGRPLGYCAPNLPLEDGDRVLPLLFSYGYYPSPPGSGNAFARRVLDRLLPVDEAAWQLGSDGLVIGLAPLYGRIASIPRALGVYRHHDRNNSEASGTNLAKIRRDLVNEANREAVLRRHAARRGVALPQALSLRIPGHCKGRLISLLLDREGHPFQGDKSGALILAGVAAAWRFPHHSFLKRISASIGFGLLPLLPRGWLGRNLDMMMLARRRGRFLRWLLPDADGLPGAPPADRRAPFQLTRKFLNCQGSSVSMSSPNRRPRSVSGVHSE